MVNIKQMPYPEKYHCVADYITKHEIMVTSFIKEHLGEPAVAEYQKICRPGLKPVPEEAPFEQKYELGYANFVWWSKCVFSFVRERMGQDGMRQFIRADVENLKRENAGPAIFFLKVIRAISPGLAFSLVARQSAYQLQWLSPFSVIELNRRKAVLDIPKCKVLDYPDSQDVCLVGCRQVYPIWIAEQFRARMRTHRQGNSCSITLTPIKAAAGN
jgi:hypothetical protein